MGQTLNSSAIRGFRKLCFITLAAVYLLILVGGIVRTTGSGMGCPDWPKCFGHWIPPATAAQLPENYKEVYASIREKKNLKFASYLKVLGLGSTADKIINSQSILAETDFNVTKAWTEYGNRLIGVVVGFFIVGLFLQSIKFRMPRPPIFFYSLATLMAVLFQGWFGSIVVSTNLTTWTVTVHVFLALLIVGLLVYLIYLSEPVRTDLHPRQPIRWILVACIIALLVQVFLGTQVRESLDVIATQLAQRSQWIGALGITFIIHRSFSLIVLLLHVVLVLKFRKTLGLNTLPVALIILILGTLLTGLGMAYFAVPEVIQPVHLVLATGAFGVQLLLFFRLNPDRKVAFVN